MSSRQKFRACTRTLLRTLLAVTWWPKMETRHLQWIDVTSLHVICERLYKEVRRRDTVDD